ncbi:MAG: alpha/beta hydrolase [bacterium]|nr:alpha/beta hydrolase [bacterium]
MNLDTLTLMATASFGAAQDPPRTWKDPPVIETPWDGLLEGIGNKNDWDLRREVLQQRFLDLIRDDRKPARPPLNLSVHDSTVVDGVYTRKRIRYDVEDGDRCEAFLAIPLRLEDSAPAVVALHGTSFQGKDITAGFEDEPGLPGLGHLDHLARRGYVVIAPDHMTMGARIVDEEPFNTDPFYARHPEWSALGKLTYDASVAVDVLLTFPEVKPRRIGAIGHSLGGLIALFLAAYDPRIRVTACIHGSQIMQFNTALDTLAQDDGCFVYLRHLRDDLRAGRLPAIDINEVMALVAPRPFLDVISLNDEYGGSPLTHRQRMLMDLRLADLYTILGVQQNFAFYTVSQYHHFLHDSRELAYAWLDKHLKRLAQIQPRVIPR